MSEKLPNCAECVDRSEVPRDILLADHEIKSANLLKLAGLVIEMDDFHDTAIEDRDPKRNTDIIWNEMVALARGIPK